MCFLLIFVPIYLRCMGGFIGVNYAASKLPWTSSMQVSCTLALISAALWFLFDRTFHGFMISLTVASMGTTVAYFLVLNGWYRYVSSFIIHSFISRRSILSFPFFFSFFLLPHSHNMQHDPCSQEPSGSCCCWNRIVYFHSFLVPFFNLSPSSSHLSAIFFPAGGFWVFHMLLLPSSMPLLVCLWAHSLFMFLRSVCVILSHFPAAHNNERNGRGIIKKGHFVRP